MRKLSNICIFFALMAAWAGFSGCDEISNPYQNAGPVTVDTTAKKVLIEEFTGFKCGNCPAAAVVAHRLKELYGSQVVLISYHVGSFAIPDKKAPFTYDFRTKSGDTLDAYFGIGTNLGTPNGLINRAKFGEDLVMNQSKWEEAVKAQLALSGDVKLSLTPSWSAATRTINLDVNIEYLKDASEAQNLSVLMVEDSIVNYQKDYTKTPPEIPEYVHNAVMRGAMSGVFGEPLGTAAIKAGTKISKKFVYVIPEGKDWRPEKLRLVAMVINPGNNYMVSQVEETQVVK